MPAIAAPQSSVSRYRAAFAEVSIMPPASELPRTELQGFFGPPRRVEAVGAPLSMQLLLLEDGWGGRTLLVTADLFGFAPEMAQNIQASASAWGLSPQAVLCNASHTHYAPGTIAHTPPGLGRFYPGYAAGICEAAHKALPGLFQGLSPAVVRCGQASARLGFNRRKPVDGQTQMQPNLDGHYDERTPFLQVEIDLGGPGPAPTVLVVNHGCHPTGLGGAKRIDAAHPGWVRQALLERGAAAAVMYLQGAAGDLKAGRLVNDAPQWTKTEEAGRASAGELAAALAGALAGPLTELEGPICWSRQNVIAALSDGRPDDHRPDRGGVTPSNSLLGQWSAVMAERHPDGAYPDSVSFKAQAVSIGQALIVALPGEPFSEVASKIRAAAPDHAVVLVAGYTNGLVGYLPTDDAIPLGGYEVAQSHHVYSLPGPFAVGVEAKVLNGVSAAVAAVRSAAAERAATSATPLVKRTHDAFFVLSAGRCGTQTLAHLLKPATNAKVWHHPEPHLIEETLAAYHGDTDATSVFWHARAVYLRKAWDAGLIHGETDHNMTAFAPAIAADVPEARFLVLVRDPREFVRSGMRRRYYDGHPWDVGRLRPSPAAPDAPEWEGLDGFDKVCWLWDETYRRIQRMIAAFDPDRSLTVRFEDLVRDVAVIRRVFEFTGLTGFDEAQANEILGLRLNAQNKGDFPHPSKWGPALHDRLWARCGVTASKFGYPQRYDAAGRP